MKNGTVYCGGSGRAIAGSLGVLIVRAMSDFYKKNRVAFRHFKPSQEKQHQSGFLLLIA